MLSFTDQSGNLFNILGSLGSILEFQRAYQASLLAAMTNSTSGVTAETQLEPDIQAVMGSSYISILNATGSVGGTLQQIAELVINRMVFRDNPRVNQTLDQLNTLASIEEVIRQMDILGATVLAMVVTGTPSLFTGVGNGVINVSTKRPLDGKTLENAFSETLLFTCSGDSYNGSAAEGNEPFDVTGVGNQGDPFAFNWPLGSNCQFGLQAIDGNSDNSSGNLLTNSGFDAWTANVPDNWSLQVGTAGTNINEENSIVYDGAAAVRVTGDAGGTLVSIRQHFDDSDGTTGELTPQTQYGVCLFLRRDGNAPSGTLTIDLVDEGGTTIIQDANSINNTFDIDLSTLTTQYAPYTGVFRTPSILPDGAYVRLRLTVAYPNGFSFYYDKLSMGEMVQSYTGGPFVCVHAGSTPFLQGDYSTCQIVNSRGAAGTLDTFQTLFGRLLPISLSNEIILPSSSTPSILDSLII